MHPWYVEVDGARLKQLYQHERLTTTEIAIRLHCSRTTIRRRPFLPADLLGILEADSYGGVSELADDPDSKSGARKGVGVQVPSPLPTCIDGLR